MVGKIPANFGGTNKKKTLEFVILINGLDRSKVICFWEKQSVTPLTLSMSKLLWMLTFCTVRQSASQSVCLSVLLSMGTSLLCHRYPNLYLGQITHLLFHVSERLGNMIVVVIIIIIVMISSHNFGDFVVIFTAQHSINVVMCCRCRSSRASSPPLDYPFGCPSVCLSVASRLTNHSLNIWKFLAVVVCILDEGALFWWRELLVHGTRMYF